MVCIQRGWTASFSFLVQFLYVFTVSLCHGSHLQPGNFYFPDKKQEHFMKTLQGYDVVTPVKVDESGHFQSYNLYHDSSSTRRKRDLNGNPNLYYKINHRAKELFFNLTVNEGFLSSNYILERRYGNHTGGKIASHSGTACHLIGTVLQPGVGSGSAAISTCSGLAGFFHLPHGDYFIEPVKSYPVEKGPYHPHIIYRRDTSQRFHKQPRSPPRQTELWGVKDNFSIALQQELRREKWERQQPKKKKISQRSVSKERWVETLVVADSKMIEYHGRENVESYIFTILNMVTGLFHDPSVGNAIHIILVRLILLEEEEKGLKIVHHADHTLASFCKWQKSINPKSDAHPAHHDVAVLLTRKDICAGMNSPCETLGLSHLSGMCQPHRSCNINEDSGLPLAFTIAHELGHSFGIQHDGQGNDCEPIGKHPYIMSRRLQYDPSPLTWSQCSKEYITRFLDRGWGSCLDDVPAKKDLKPPLVAPGVLYDVHHQCQLQYGLNSTFCEEVDNICQTLWCLVKGSCRSKLDAAADGTRCGENKWCFSGECITIGKHPESISGGWGEWTAWTHCTRTCGAGVQSAERQCNNPEPQFGGKYCTGERKRYRMCEILPCLNEMPTFRQMQCSEFDTVPYKNELYQWIPIPNPANPCELDCRPIDGRFSEKMLDAVIDGTTCFEGNNSRDICINGMCKNVGCDYELNSFAMEDRCGVCLGDGSTCQTVKKTFNQTEGFGYVDIALIPKDARDIRIMEVEEAGNFLAIRSEDPEKYYLNGGFIIQWNGDYSFAGTKFQYERNGNLENLVASGPTNESLWIQLLFQENNPGIKYEYTIRKDGNTENEIGDQEYYWQYGGWTVCSVTCGTGIKRQAVRCVKKGRGVVKNTFCDAETQPSTRQKNCNEKDCPPRWWVGEWQKCSTTCGPSGEKKRTVLCIQTVGSDEQALPAKDCQHLPKPKAHFSCNRDILCPSDWTVSNWSECTVTCGGGLRSRNVTCTKNKGEPCDISKRPNSKALCGLQQCPFLTKSLPPQTETKRGKFIIRTIPRKAVPIPKRGPLGGTLLPEVKPQFLTTAKTPEPLITSTSSLSSFSPMKPPGNEDSKENKVQMNSTHSNTDYKSDFFLIKNTSQEKDISKPIGNKMVSDLELGHSTDLGLTNAPMNDPNVTFTSDQSTVEVTASYSYFTEESDTETDDNTDGSTEDNENLQDSFDPVQNKSVVKSRSTIPKERSFTLRNNNETLKMLPTFSPGMSPTSFSFTTAAEGLSYSNTTRSPATINMQITEPLEKNEVTEISVTKHPNLVEKGSRLLKDHANYVMQPNIDQTIDHQDSESHIPEHTPRNSTPNSDKNSLNSLKYDNPPGLSNNVTRSAYWITGNWSECSTTCGLGAVWRHVQCNTTTESDCQHVKKPDPARRCHLRPCATWTTGNWSKCSKNCGEGFKTREVYCINAHEKRSLRPFHCQLSGHQPRHNISCNVKPCSEWLVEPWRECSASCGDGIQHRTITCIDMDNMKTEDPNLCEEDKPKPQETRKCKIQMCQEKTGLACTKDKMSVNFCQTVKSIGKCSLPAIQTQCCFTCSLQ
ncbi:A disintegrin and metalloproteinase with thrombospondin motifs 12 isoform X2 [Rhinatrema bivittatum]|nr:A disintegrin and metalloproteinase with thrombospondin motifs 12 isoform X2 [Rhinatrema bivittatum]XP_029435004.1 A disintegrin and metalloproteinase with thrombospondin motifs 12 isoform X2 [Rhinatrema bivittatum]XP_029435015.1 A disintegrin and metalloproteinase with thrombospondin motifs 12 isoform X2 [Rhinatrema bivittatum]